MEQDLLVQQQIERPLPNIVPPTPTTPPTRPGPPPQGNNPPPLPGSRPGVNVEEPTETSPPERPQPPGGETDPLTGEAVHRFWDEQTQSHFFTANEGEFSDRENNPRYRYEGIEFNTPSPDITGALPVYRFENQQTGTFFYTLQSPDDITSQFPVLENDGIAFYAFSETTAPADAVPVFRFFNENASLATGTPVHFFTGTEENKDNVIANVPGFTFEGPGWYAFES